MSKAYAPVPEKAISDRAAADVVEALGVLPETVWLHGDDACDCTFQRIGLWKNPYIGETLEVRMCCIWAELYRLFPQHVRATPAYLTGDDEWLEGQREWDGETEMPRALWYRQIARETGRPLQAIREEYANIPSPAGTPRPTPPPTVDPIAALFDAVTKLAIAVRELQEKDTR